MNALQFESLKKNVRYFSEKLVSPNFQALNITLEHNDVFDALPPLTARGDLIFALFNPPYGERLGSKKEARKTYEKIGQLLTNHPLDIDIRGAILIPEMDSLRSFLATLKAFTTKEYAVRQGGKKITIVVFSRPSNHPPEPCNL